MSGITLSKKLFLLFFRHRIIHHLSIYLFFFCFNIIFYCIIDAINVSIVFIFPFRYLHFSSVDIYIFFLLIFYNVKFRFKFIRSRLRSRTRVRSVVTLMTCLVIRNVYTLLYMHVLVIYRILRRIEANVTRAALGIHTYVSSRIKLHVVYSQ